MNRYIKVFLIAILIVAVNITAVYALNTTDIQKTQIANDAAYIQFNKDMYDLYNIQRTTIRFDENNPDTYVYQPSKEINGTEYLLNLTKIKQGQGNNFNLKNCLDGSYFVYSAAVTGAAERKRPSTLTYSTAKRGINESQYLGYNFDGANYENPAYPWNSWNSSKPLKTWTFIKEPWNKQYIRDKYKINRDGGILSEANMNLRNKVVDLSKSIELGIYAKYINFAAKETVKAGGVSNADLNKSIYYGYQVSSAELNKKFGFIKPNVFKSTETWQDYVYVLTPPTRETWGSGFMFYSNPTALQGVDYVTIPLAPLDMVEQQKVVKLTSSNVDGCFLSTPQKVYNSKTKKYEMKTWVIRFVKEPITTSGSYPIQIWQKLNQVETPFANDKMGTKIFDEDVIFTPEHPYWVKEITYPVPGVGNESGIFVFDGDSTTPAYNYTWRVLDNDFAPGSHTTSGESLFDNLPTLPWAKIKAEYGITREPKITYPN